jgi:serine/threonine protein kinase
MSDAGALPETVGDGRYAVEDVLGTGGMSVVLGARDVVLDRDVAVKVLADNLALDPEARQRFEVEARAAGGLRHPSIVQVLDVGEHDGRPFIVMERAGADLRGRGPLPPEEVVGIARAVLGGLGHAHTAGTLHRDLKPGNLLVTTDGRVRIADFGIARAVEGPDLTRTGLVVGTAAYIAPERLRGQPATVRSDLYSLGATLFELLTGAPPTDGQDGAPPGILPDDTPPGLRAVVDRCLARDPDRRPADVDAALAMLSGDTATLVLPSAGTATATQVVATETGGWWRGARAWIAERPWVLLAAAVVVLVVVAGTRGGDAPAPGAEASEAAVPPLETSGDDPATVARDTAEWLRDLGG